MRQFHFDFCCFFKFLDRIFLNGFPYPFLVRSRPSFLFEPIVHFSLKGLVHMRHFEFDFLFFFFLSHFFKKWLSQFTLSLF